MPSGREPIAQCLAGAIAIAPVVYACRTLRRLTGRRLYPILRRRIGEGPASPVYV